MRYGWHSRGGEVCVYRGEEHCIHALVVNSIAQLAASSCQSDLGYQDVYKDQ